MGAELQLIISRLREAYDGDPWFGKSMKQLLESVSAEDVFVSPSGQHSIMQLLWHINNWKEFTISRLRPGNDPSLSRFEEADWRANPERDDSLWEEALEQFRQLHDELVSLLQQQDDSLLSRMVPGRKYDFRKLLNGILEHDVYHMGQIAYVSKKQKEERRKDDLPSI